MGVRTEKREKVKGREDLRVLSVKWSERAPNQFCFRRQTEENINRPIGVKIREGKSCFFRIFLLDNKQ